MKSFDQFVGLSGTPRSGSTLLSAILSQNPIIHAEGNSALCQLMFDVHKSCFQQCKEQLSANNRQVSTTKDILSLLPHIYYKNIDTKERIVIDKCRAWTSLSNKDLLTTYIDNNIKIIVLERPFIEIINSFAKVFYENSILDKKNLLHLLTPNSEPVLRSIGNVRIAKKNNSYNNFLFITYDELINKTKETIDKIYKFCNWKTFNHNFENVICKYPENDLIYGIPLHKIRSKISIEQKEIKLPDDVIEICQIIQKEIDSNI